MMLILKNQQRVSEAAWNDRVRKYGSGIYCPERDAYCSILHENPDGICRREICIKDDPENIRQQRIIEENRRRFDAQLKEEEKPVFVPPRRRTKEDKEWDEIHRMERKARYLYLNNKPKAADNLMASARFRRGELKRLETERKERRKNDSGSSIGPYKSASTESKA